MAKYVVRPKAYRAGETKETRYYGVAVSSRQVTLEQMAQDINERCSLTESDVIATAKALSYEIHRHLLDGDTVYLQDIGLFFVSASSEGFETPEECTPSKVVARRVCFKADRKIRSVLGEIKFELKERKK